MINPADDVEARAAVLAAYEHVGPVYLRFGRLAVPVFNDESSYRFTLGKGIVLKEGRDVSVIATGLCVNEAREAEKLLAADGIDAEIINIHTIKPLDEGTDYRIRTKNRQSCNGGGAFRDRRSWKCSLRCAGGKSADKSTKAWNER